jgi:hypothetical protein
MTTKTTTWGIGLATLLGCGCPLVTEGTMDAGDDSSSSSASEDSDDGHGTVTVNTMLTTADDSGSSDDDSGSSGSDTSEGSSEGEESSSTGEPPAPVTEHALQFNGASFARKSSQGGEYGWSDPEWTVETWIEILDENATGVLFDAQNGGATGWALYFQPDWRSLVFSFYDSGNVNQVVEGPQVEQIGVGWHHIAATKVTDTVYLHVDGVAVKAQLVSDLPAYGPVTLSVGTVSTNEQFWDLNGVIIDEIRVTNYPIYDSNFDPPVVLDNDVEGALVLLKFDEGAGVIATESATEDGMNFTITNPNWVEGRYDDDV